MRLQSAIFSRALAACVCLLAMVLSMPALTQPAAPKVDKQVGNIEGLPSRPATGSAVKFEGLPMPLRATEVQGPDNANARTAAPNTAGGVQVANPAAGQQSRFIGDTPEGSNIKSNPAIANAPEASHATNGAEQGTFVGGAEDGLGIRRKPPRKARPRGGRRGH